jgi:hypothetical protein
VIRVPDGTLAYKGFGVSAVQPGIYLTWTFTAPTRTSSRCVITTAAAAGTTTAMTTKIDRFCLPRVDEVRS